MRPENEVNYAANPYGYPPKRDRPPLFSKGLLLTVAVVALFGGGATVYFTMVRGGSLGGPPPILEPDPSPTKSRPPEAASEVDPSAKAMEDRLVYERLSGTPRAAVERLLPPPEQPIPRPIVVAEPKENPPALAASSQSSAPSAAPPSAQQVVTVTPPAATPASAAPVPAIQAPASPPPRAAVPAAAAKPAPAATPAPAPAPVAVAKVAPPTTLTPAGAPASTPTAAAGGTRWRVQLASVHSEAEAAAEWKRLSGRYPDALGGLSLQIAKADLGEKGVYYRVQGGSVDEGRARAICDQLKSQNVGCVVVRP